MEQRIAIGGVMRCCMETIRLYVQDGNVPEVGEKLYCGVSRPKGHGYVIATHDGDPNSPIIWRWPGPGGEG